MPTSIEFPEVQTLMRQDAQVVEGLASDEYDEERLRVASNSPLKQLSRQTTRGLRRWRKDEPASDAAAVVDEVMEPGPTTIRPDELLETLVPRLKERRVETTIITVPSGQLVGILFRDDAERRLEEFKAGEGRGA